MKTKTWEMTVRLFDGPGDGKEHAGVELRNLDEYMVEILVEPSATRRVIKMHRSELRLMIDELDRAAEVVEDL